MKWVNEHRLRHNFQDCLNPLCSCSLESENRLHYLLHCYHFSQHRIDLMNSVESVSNIFESSCDNNTSVWRLTFRQKQKQSYFRGNFNLYLKILKDSLDPSLNYYFFNVYASPNHLK